MYHLKFDSQLASKTSKNMQSKIDCTQKEKKRYCYSIITNRLSGAASNNSCLLFFRNWHKYETNFISGLEYGQSFKIGKVPDSFLISQCSLRMKSEALLIDLRSTVHAQKGKVSLKLKNSLFFYLFAWITFVVFTFLGFFFQKFSKDNFFQRFSDWLSRYKQKKRMEDWIKC